MEETREYNAEYYDAATTQTADIDFYRPFVDDSKDVLELGCGSGRCSWPLALLAKSYVAVDNSRPMLERARKKGSDSSAEFIEGDLTKIELGREFALIIAPFRVLQCLEAPEDVRSFFRVIRKHLSQDGSAIINVFKPSLSKDEMASKWIREAEKPCGEYTLLNGDVLRVSDSYKRIDAHGQVLYPEMIYRRYRNDELVDTHVNPISMRYWYPGEFKQLVLDEGFAIKECWGGYEGQTYGDGPELVVHFQVGA
jgi:SAM-dependent methyltransferase